VVKAEISTAGYFYEIAEQADLQELGFTFEPREAGYWRIDMHGNRYRPEGGSIRGQPVIEFNSLEDVIAFVNKYGRIVIGPSKDGWDVTIYDDYIE
jgi:hypothetical protein